MAEKSGRPSLVANRATLPQKWPLTPWNVAADRNDLTNGALAASAWQAAPGLLGLHPGDDLGANFTFRRFNQLGCLTAIS